MIKKIFGTMAIVAAMFAGNSAYNAQNERELTGFALANVEALARREALDCSYVREDNKCTIEVGAKGEIRLLGGSILKAGADGNITFDGQVVCSSGGNKTCKPVECVELYTVIE